MDTTPTYRLMLSVTHDGVTLSQEWDNTGGGYGLVKMRRMALAKLAAHQFTAAQIVRVQDSVVVWQVG